MIETLLIILGSLIVLLWLMTMILWWRTEQEKPVKTVKRQDVIHAWNKAARLARRSWYGSLRYSKQAVRWGTRKTSTAFIAVFPKSKAAFAKQDMLTGLEHGASSYYLASLSKKVKPTIRKPLSKRKKRPDDITGLQHLSEE
jgi:hypothetical protein